MSKTSLTCQGPELDVIGPPLQFLSVLHGFDVHAIQGAWDESRQVDFGGVSWLNLFAEHACSFVGDEFDQVVGPAGAVAGDDWHHSLLSPNVANPQLDWFPRKTTCPTFRLHERLLSEWCKKSSEWMNTAA